MVVVADRAGADDGHPHRLRPGFCRHRSDRLLGRLRPQGWVRKARCPAARRVSLPFNPVLLSCTGLRKRPMPSSTRRPRAEEIPHGERTQIRVAIIGLGFGAEFIPIYQNYPGAEVVAICRRSAKDLDECGDRWGIGKRYTDFEDVLNDPNIDAVHINSPIPDHASQSLAALEAGKHVACTVPMATTVEECRKIVEAQRRVGQGLHDDGDGRLQPRVPVRQGAVRQRRARARSSSSADRTSRTWPAGRATGRACRRCTTPPTASAPAWRCSASTPSTSSATARAGSARS